MLLRSIVLIAHTSFTLLILSLAAPSLSYARDNTVLIVGDSLSAAYGIEAELGWVSLLANRLNDYSKDKQWNVANASVSGETTTGGLARLPGLIEQYDPVLCIIELGANDGLRGQSTATTRSNLDQMVKYCNESGTTLLVGTKLPPNYGEKYTRAFESIYIHVTNENNISLVPFLLDGFASKEKYFQADGLHPTADAQPLILENIWPKFIKALDSIQ